MNKRIWYIHRSLHWKPIILITVTLRSRSMSGGALREIWVFWVGLDTRTYEKASGNTMKIELIFDERQLAIAAFNIQPGLPQTAAPHPDTDIWLCSFLACFKSRNKQIVIIAHRSTVTLTHRFNINPGSAFWCAWAIVSRIDRWRRPSLFVVQPGQRSDQPAQSKFPLKQILCDALERNRHSGSSPSKRRWL